MEAVKLLLSNPISRKTFDFLNLFKDQRRHFIFCFVGDYSFFYRSTIRLIYFPFRIGFSRRFSDMNKPEMTTLFIPVEENQILDFYDYLKGQTRNYIRYMLPKAVDFEVARDKLEMSVFFIKAGMKIVPEVFQNIQTAKLPVIVKPRHGAGSRGIMRIYKEHEIDSSYNFDDYVIQELLFKSNTVFGVFAFVENGIVKSYYVHERIFTYPSKGGVTVYSKRKSNNEDFDKIITQATQQLSWNGLIMLEIMFDNEGDFKIIEINPRLWGSLLLSKSVVDNPIYEYVYSQLPELSISQPRYQPDKEYLFWLLPYGLKYIFGKEVIKSLVDQKILFINFSFSSFLRSLFFHLILYVFKLSRKIYCLRL